MAKKCSLFDNTKNKMNKTTTLHFIKFFLNNFEYFLRVSRSFIQF